MRISDLFKSSPYWMINKNMARELGLRESIFITEMYFRQELSTNTRSLKTINGSRYFCFTSKEMTELFGLSYAEQSTIIKRLKNLNILDVILCGIPCRSYYRLNTSVLLDITGYDIENVYIKGKHSSVKNFNNLKKTYKPSHKDMYLSMDYELFLKTDYWRCITAFMRYKSNYSCSNCSSNTKLQVHHLSYDNHGEEHNNLQDLMVLCEKCHMKIHNK